MKRDFSNSTREQIIEIIDNNRAYFYSGDITGETLFSCQEASGEDYSQFYDEIEECVQGANTAYLVTDGKIDNLIEEINTVFDAAQEKDGEYADIVEANITHTTENYISDLKTLAAALDVSGANNVSVDNLEGLEAGDMGSIFGDSTEFEDLLKDIDNPLYEEFLAQFIDENGKYNYEAISNYFAENEDDLSLWELQAFESILLSYVVINPETGKLDEKALEELEKFLEACYYNIPDAYEDGIKDDYYVYLLHDEYAQIFAYYDAHVDAMLDAYPGALNEDSENWNIYSALADMDALLEGVYLHGQEVQISSFKEDEVNGGYLDEQVPNVFNINITSDDSWMYIVYQDAETEQINVSHFGPLDDSINASEYYNNEQALVDPNDAYINSLQEGFGDYIFSHLTGPLEDLIPEPVQEALDVVEIFTDAEEAREEQEETNQELHEAMNLNAHLLLIGDASGENIACNGNLISCGGETSLTNHQFDEGALEDLVDDYNSAHPGANIDADAMIAAVTDPSCVDFSDPNIEQFLGIAQNQK